MWLKLKPWTSVIVCYSEKKCCGCRVHTSILVMQNTTIATFHASREKVTKSGAWVLEYLSPRGKKIRVRKKNRVKSKFCLGSYEVLRPKPRGRCGANVSTKYQDAVKVLEAEKFTWSFLKKTIWDTNGWKTFVCGLYFEEGAVGIDWLIIWKNRDRYTPKEWLMLFYSHFLVS